MTEPLILHPQWRESAKKCKEYIKQITATPEVGEVYDGVVTKIMDFGAFVEILPGKEGLTYIFLR